MDLKRRPPEPGSGIVADGALAEEIARVIAIWTDCRARFGSSGNFMFGRFSAADAFYAPVAIIGMCSAERSSSRMRSMTPVKASSLGRRTGSLRR